MRPAGLTWPAWASTCSIARSWSTCSSRAPPPISATSSCRRSIAGHRVQAHLFDGYWEDIGTVGAFHQANIDLTGENPAFDFASEAGPIFTRPRFLACSRIAGATVKNSLICDGCVIGRGSVIENSVIGVRARIAENVTIRDTYIMGIDFLEHSHQWAENQRLGRPPFGIGANSVIERAIIDKNARIGRNVRVINERGTARNGRQPHPRDPRRRRRDPQVRHLDGWNRDLDVLGSRMRQARDWRRPGHGRMGDSRQGLAQGVPRAKRPGPCRQGIDLEIKHGECFGLLGPNGAGKTTTVEILEGLNSPRPAKSKSWACSWATDEVAIRERIGVTLQETRFPDKETVREIVTLFRSFYKSGMDPTT